MKNSRTAVWVDKIEEVIKNEFCDTVKGILKNKLDTYEYDNLKDNLNYNLGRILFRNGSDVENLMADLKETTKGVVDKSDFPERILEIIGLIDGILEIAEYAHGTLEQEKEVEKALFDDGGKYLTELLDRIAGEA